MRGMSSGKGVGVKKIVKVISSTSPQQLIHVKLLSFPKPLLLAPFPFLIAAVLYEQIN